MTLHWRNPSSFSWTCSKKSGWIANCLSKRNFNLRILWHILASKFQCPLDDNAVPRPEFSWGTPDFSMKIQNDSSLVSLKTTIMTSIFPSKYSFQSQFSLPPLSHPNVASVGNYHYVFIQGQPTEEAVVLELSAWVCWLRWGTAGRRDGGRDGWMAAEEVYSCLQARPYLSRLLLWRRPSCHHAAHTKRLHMRVSWAALFVSHPVCHLLTLSLFPCRSLLCQLIFIYWVLFIVYISKQPFILKWWI